MEELCLEQLTDENDEEQSPQSVQQQQIDDGHFTAGNCMLPAYRPNCAQLLLYKLYFTYNLMRLYIMHDSSKNILENLADIFGSKFGASIRV